ncbi:glycosyl hydrolase family 65 protein [Microlunatus spumicola]|uniref:Glycosyl hydrolase family 65 protein n=1 Tax=Microlunatus spumicola TaxID=81499 RepID=A0ABP6XW73_9ACTN
MRGSHEDTPPHHQDPLDRARFPVRDWSLSEVVYGAGDLGVTETLFAVGNGYLGMRGNVEEGRETYAHGTFINGFHETYPIRHAEEAFGFAKVGQTIVNVPDNKTIKLYVDDEPLLLPVADLEDYERTLDFRDGVLHRDLIWRTPAGKRVQVSSRRMVSFTQRHLAIMTFEVTMLDDSAPVVISSQTLNRQDGRDEYHVRSAAMGEGNLADPRKAEGFHERVLEPQTHSADGHRLMMGYRCAHSGMTLAVGVDHQIITENAYTEHISADEDTGKMVYRVAASRGQTITVVKTVTYHTSRGVPVRELNDRCRRVLDRVADHGIDRELADQRRWLDAYWDRSDVVLTGQPELQQAVRWNLFQIAQAAARAEQSGVPAKGVTGSGYSGHYFWDTEIYVLPFLTYTSPSMARSAMRFRYKLLDAARSRARELTQVGALYPWRTINGSEASAYYAAGTAQYHIDADVAFALCKYVAASGDHDFMNREGIDILVETARMWADLGFWRENGGGRRSFHIHGVTGPDEYTTVVNDNLFTNVMARFNLDQAAWTLGWMRTEAPQAYALAVERLAIGQDEAAEWTAAARAMTILFDPVTGINPQDSLFLDREVWDLANTPKAMRPLLLHYHPLVIYRFQVLKQADVVLALFLQGDHFTAEQKRVDFEYYDPITTGDSTLSGVVQSIIAAEVGYADLALRYFQNSLYVDLANLHGNTSDGVHVASTGGVWNALVYGFAGMRDYNGVITFDPRLPEAWPSLSFQLTLRGTRVRVDLEARRMGFVVLEGGQAELSVRGHRVVVSAAAPVWVPLEDQGPRLHGPIGSRGGERRPDGTLITASVPQATKV